MALIPYLALAGIYTWFIDGHKKDFWFAAGVLIGGRFIYAVLDSMTSAVAWRVYARKRTAEKMLKLFVDARMPMRCYPNETLSLYLFRINDAGYGHSVVVKWAARELSTLIDQSKRETVCCKVAASSKPFRRLQPVHDQQHHSESPRCQLDIYLFRLRPWSDKRDRDQQLHAFRFT
ncbi:hypothetical protein [Paraburkholderia graminis]|uniref:hypothetical protein n=1 Tax=Paraburkholderia graminis TaxID=60548 RepID=UPI0038BD1966